MSIKQSRARFSAAIVVAFLCGLLFASGFDLTRFGWAQAKVTTKTTPAEVKLLAETESAFEAIADKVTPAVVSVQVQRTTRNRPVSRPRSQRLPQGTPPGLDEFFRQFDAPQNDQAQEGSGSGFIVSKDGYILTNNHVVADMDKVTVGLLDRRVFEARVVGRDPTTDVAVIKIEANNLPVVSFGDDAKARVGSWVLAIGNPLQLDFTVTAGIVSAKGRNANGLLGPNNQYAITDYIQTDAAINPGNSGGPLVNIRGEVIGINSAIASGTGFYAGYGFAIPISLAQEVMDDIIKYGRVRRAIVGVGIDDVSPSDAKAAGLTEIRGAKIGSFSGDNSPAEKAGIEIGDIIVSVNGRPVETRSGLQRVIRAYEPGETVDVEVARFGQRKHFKVKLAEAPDETNQVARAEDAARPADADRGREFDKIGIAVQAMSPEFATRFKLSEANRRGVVISDVTSAGPAHRELFPNEVILQELYPTKRDITSTADLDKALAPLKRGDVIEFKVWSPALGLNGGTRAVSVAVQR